MLLKKPKQPSEDDLTWGGLGGCGNLLLDGTSPNTIVMI